MKTAEQQKEYRHKYYEQHKNYHYQKYQEWCNENPEQAKAIQKRWRVKNPHYYRNYMRKRKSVTEPLIFQFLDNGFDGIDDFILHLQIIGVSEQHVNWFLKDVQKYLKEV